MLNLTLSVQLIVKLSIQILIYSQPYYLHFLINTLIIDFYFYVVLLVLTVHTFATFLEKIGNYKEGQGNGTEHATGK